MPDTVTRFAPAKINLYLHVTGKRDDGYHLLDSLIVFADIGDEISVSVSDHYSLVIDGPFAAGLSSSNDNLVSKAAFMLAELADVKPDAAVRLVKNLPIASGIGGGSADAAATLLALNEFWQLSLSQQDLLPLAERLGADVPVCLFGAPAFIEGIGEIMTPAPSLPASWLVLVNPGIGISTPEVFQNRTEAFSQNQSFSEQIQTTEELAVHLALRRNDLSNAACSLVPEISNVLGQIEQTDGVHLARLSGSGATCFGLYGDQDSAALAADSIQKNHPSWWVNAAQICS